MIVVISVLLLLALTGLLGALESILANSEMLLDSQPSSVESGFEKLWHSAYISSPFFLLAVLFVLFDMELILIMPCVFFMSSSVWLASSQVIMGAVTLTLLLEWVASGLKWHL